MSSIVTRVDQDVKFSFTPFALFCSIFTAFLTIAVGFFLLFRSIIPSWGVLLLAAISVISSLLFWVAIIVALFIYEVIKGGLLKKATLPEK